MSSLSKGSISFSIIVFSLRCAELAQPLQASGSMNTAKHTVQSLPARRQHPSAHATRKPRLRLVRTVDLVKRIDEGRAKLHPAPDAPVLTRRQRLAYFGLGLTLGGLALTVSFLTSGLA